MGKSRRAMLIAAMCAAVACGCLIVNREEGLRRSRFESYIASARPAGWGRRFRPSPHDQAVGRSRSIAGMDCRRRAHGFALAHVELFAEDRVVLMPAGIGVAGPLRRRGAHVLGGSCSYPVQTREPTGVVLLSRGRHYSVGSLFAVWGQRLGPRRLLSFAASGKAAVSVFVDGRRWRGAAAAAPLRPESQVTIEIGPFVPPHPDYEFPCVCEVLR